MATAPPQSLELPPGLPAEVYQWHTPTAEFAVPRSRFIINLVAGIFAMIPALGLLVGGVIISGAILFGDAPANPKGRSPWPMALGAFALGLALTLGIVFWVLGTYRSRGTRVLLFPRGLVRLQHGAAAVCRWEDVQKVTHEMNTGSREKKLVPRHRFVVACRDGTTLDFQHIPKTRELGERIQEATLKHLMPLALQVYQTGKPVKFGPLTVSREGVGNGKETVPWVDVKDVQIDKHGQLVFTTQGRWLSFAKVPVEEIPNVHVLLALVRQARGPY